MTDPTFATIRARLRYRSLNEFIKGYGKFISRGGIFVPMAAQKLKPVGTAVRFQFLLADGTSAFLGEGIVRKIKGMENESEDGPAGLIIKFTKLSQDSKSVVERIVTEKRRDEVVQQSRATEPSARAASITVEQPVFAGEPGPSESITGVLAAGEVDSHRRASSLGDVELDGHLQEQGKPESPSSDENAGEVERSLDETRFDSTVSEVNRAAPGDGDFEPVSEPAQRAEESDGDDWDGSLLGVPSSEEWNDEGESEGFPFEQSDSEGVNGPGSSGVVRGDDSEEEFGLDALFEAADGSSGSEDSNLVKAEAAKDEEDLFEAASSSAVASEFDGAQLREEVIEQQAVIAPKVIKETEAGIKVMSFDGRDIDESATREFEEFANSGDEDEFDELFDNIFGGDGGNGLLGGEGEDVRGSEPARISPAAGGPLESRSEEGPSDSSSGGLAMEESSFGIELDGNDVAEELPSSAFGKEATEIPIPLFGEGNEFLPSPSFGGEEGTQEDSNEEFLGASNQAAFAKGAEGSVPPSVKDAPDLLGEVDADFESEFPGREEGSSDLSWSVAEQKEEASQEAGDEDSSDRILSLFSLEDDEKGELSLNLSAGLRGESSSAEDEEEDSLRSLVMSEKMRIENRFEEDEEEDSDRDILDDLLGDDDLPPPGMASSFAAPKPGEKKKKGFMSKFFGKD